jgi:leader peptidase (prepilin peptidase)/N-methyltransferase
MMPTLELLQHSLPFLIVVVAILGALVGSFLNVVIYRLPIMLQREWLHECNTLLELPQAEAHQDTFNSLLPRSHCPQCKHAIAAWQNIPLISYLLLRARCFYCKKRIAAHYFLVELLSTAAAIFLAYRFGYSMALVTHLLFTWFLIPMLFIDWQHQLLPDELTLGLLWLGLLVSLLSGGLAPSTAIISAALAYVLFYLSAWLFQKLLKREGLGHGDFKLLAALSAWCGWTLLPLLIFIASIAGCLVGFAIMIKKRQFKSEPYAFGPYLAITGWCLLLWGAPLNQWLFQTLAA